MDQFVGLDVSQRETAICVIDGGGNKIWQGRSITEPGELALLISARAPHAVAVGMETGPLCTWLWHALQEQNVPIVSLHAREASAALSLQANKTDDNDAYGLAQIVRTGWYRPVSVKSMCSHRLRTILTARAKLVSVRTTLYNQIRGLLKTYGVILGPAKGSSFAERVRAAMPVDESAAAAIEGLLQVWIETGVQKHALELRIHRFVSKHPVCRRLMTTPGIGAITAAMFVSTIDDPGRFKRSSDVGAYLGLTPIRYQSGEVDRSGRISKCGDRMMRSYLFEAATVILSRSKSEFPLRSWALALARRAGTRKARVALARRLAVLLHRMWLDGTTFQMHPEPS